MAKRKKETIEGIQGQVHEDLPEELEIQGDPRDPGKMGAHPQPRSSTPPADANR